MDTEKLIQRGVDKAVNFGEYEGSFSRLRASFRAEAARRWSPYNHPYFNHFKGLPNTSPRKDAFLTQLRKNAQDGIAIGFFDIGTMLHYELIDYEQQYKKLKEELVEAKSYFNGNPGKDKVTVYLLSDGQVTTDVTPSSPTEPGKTDLLTIHPHHIRIIDRRIYPRSIMQDLQRKIEQDDGINEKGAPKIIIKSSEAAFNIAKGEFVNQTDAIALAKILEKLAKQVKNPLKKPFEIFSQRARIYNHHE